MIVEGGVPTGLGKDDQDWRRSVPSLLRVSCVPVA